MGSITLRSTSGATQDVDDSDHVKLGYLLDHGWAQEKPDEGLDRAVRQGKVEGYGVNTVSGQILAGLSEALGGATFGASQYLEAQSPVGRERIQLGREEHPTLTGAANAVGMVAPALLSGGSALAGDAAIAAGRAEGAGLLARVGGRLAEAGRGAAGAIARATPSGVVANLGARIVEGAAGRGIIGRTVAAAAGGAIQAVPAEIGSYIANQAIADHDLTAEGFWGAAKRGLVFGGGGGAALSLGADALVGAKKLFAQSEVTEQSAHAAEQQAATELGGVVADSAYLEKAARGKVRDYRHARVTTDPAAAVKAEQIKNAAEAEQRAAAMEAFGNGPQPNAAPNLRIVPRETPVPPAADTPLAPGQAPLEPWESPEAASRARSTPATPLGKGARNPPRYVAAGTPDDDLLSRLEQSNSRLQAGGKIADLTAEARSVPRTPEMGSPEDVAAELAARPAGGRARGGKAYMKNGRIVSEDEFTSGRLPARQPYRAPIDEVGIADAAPAMSRGTSDDDLESLLTQSVKRTASGEPIQSLSAEARAARPSVDRQIDGAIAELDPQVAKLHALSDEVEAARADVTAHLKAMHAPEVATTTPDVIADILALRQHQPPIEESITKALRGRLALSEDLPTAIPAIQRLEKAEADLADAVGADHSPPGSVRRAAAYREAQDAHRDTQAAASAQAAQSVGDAAQGKLAGAQATNAAEELATPPLPAQPSSPPSGVSKAAKWVADAGTVLEVLSSLHVPGLPHPKDIPFIGPVLSLYLKARATSAIWRKLGGKIPGSVEASLAASAASSRNRLASAVGSVIDAGVQSTRMAMPAAPLVSDILGRRLFADERDAKHRPGTSKDTDVLMAARADELRRAMEPGAMTASLRDRIRTTDPALARSVLDVAMRKITYLSEHIPRSPQSLNGIGSRGTPWPVPAAEVRRFAQIVDALDDPIAVIERAAAGDVSIDQIKAVKTVYPRLYAEGQRECLSRISERDDVPYRRRIQLGILFGVPLDPTQEPAFFSKQQAGLAPAPQAGAPQGSQAPQASLLKPLGLSNAAQLQEQVMRGSAIA